MADPIRILVADDHPIVRDGLIAILGTQPDLVVVGEAATGADVIRQVAQLLPDVVLLDLDMPDMNGVEALRRLQAERPDLRAIIFTAFDTDELIVDAVRAGAKGYLLKGAPREEVFRAIRTVHAGGSLVQPVVVSKLLRHIRQTGERPAIEPLTERETAVLKRLAQGRSNKEIGLELSIGERTVKFHVSSILSKLHAANRTEAVTLAMLRGLVKLTEPE